MANHSDEEVREEVVRTGHVLVGGTGSFDGWLTCPNCGEKHDAWTQVLEDGSTPEAGSVIICFDCGAVRELQEDGTATQMSPEVQKEFFTETPEMARLVAGLQARYVERRGRHG